jgi:hypothetical protein
MGGRESNARQGGQRASRELAAEERERLAGERERAVSEREAALAEREQHLNVSIQALGVAVETLAHRMLDTIERSRSLLDLTGQRLNQEILRADYGSQIERARSLQHQALAAMDSFAASEEGIARTYDGLAASGSDRREEYVQTARAARQAARNAREVLSSFTARRGREPDDSFRR